jgi:hypothetical protein
MILINLGKLDDADHYELEKLEGVQVIGTGRTSEAMTEAAKCGYFGTDTRWRRKRNELIFFHRVSQSCPKEPYFDESVFHRVLRHKPPKWGLIFHHGRFEGKSVFRGCARDCLDLHPRQRNSSSLSECSYQRDGRIFTSCFGGRAGIFHTYGLVGSRPDRRFYC